MKSDSCILSIIIPVFNAEAYIERVLSNISSQTFQHYEVFLLNNQSTDRTEELANDAAEKNRRISIHSAMDRGIYDAMNKGIRMAKGEWLYFMGADDLFYKEDVLLNLNEYFSDKVDIVYGDSLWVPDNVREEGECLPQTLVHRNINHQRVFYRRSLFDAFGNFDIRYKVAADHELNIRLFCETGIRRKYIPLLVAKFNATGFSANKVDAVFWRNWKQIFRQNLSKHLSEKEMYDKLGWYCRYQLDQKNFVSSFLLFWDVLLHTCSPGFVMLTFRHLFQKKEYSAS